MQSDKRYIDGVGLELLMAQSLSPRAWRKNQSLSLAAAAMRLGIRGKNPARTWQRWENGQYAVPLSVIIAVEQISGGQVTPTSWAAVKRTYTEGRVG